MTELTEENIRQSIGKICDPESGRPIADCGMLKELSWSEGQLHAKIGLTTFAAPLRSEFHQKILKHIETNFPSIERPEIQIVTHDKPPLPVGQIGLKVKCVIAVGSGKGGVGKSTISTMLALGLHRAGCQVGLLDSDVYGPSVPHLLGVNEPLEQKEKKIVPVDCDGLKVVSIGLMIPPDQAVIWRGPMLHSAMATFLRDTMWGDLDYLIIDMPPGTGDIALSVSQMIPLNGAIVVCTPQEVALIDVVKAVGMYRTLKIPLLGMVENMSGFVCPDNGKRYDIFGAGGAKSLAEKESIPFLGEVPITMPLRELADAGRLGDCYKDEATAEIFDEVTRNLVRSLAEKAEREKPMPQLPIL